MSADNYGDYPTSHSCSGHALDEPINKNFCFTADDLGLDRECSADRTVDSSTGHVSQGGRHS